MNDFNLLSKDERQEYEYIMAVADLAPFVVQYGTDKVMNDLLSCAASMMNPGNYGPDYE